MRIDNYLPKLAEIFPNLFIECERLQEIKRNVNEEFEKSKRYSRKNQKNDRINRFKTLGPNL